MQHSEPSAAELEWRRLNGLAQMILILDWLTPIGVLIGIIGWIIGWPHAVAIFWLSLGGFFGLTLLYGVLLDHNMIHKQPSGSGPGQVGPPPRLT